MIPWRALLHLLRGPLLAYLGLGVALWFVPLLNILHVESAAVVALVSFFVAGVSSLELFRERWTFREALVAQELALLIPWALLTLTLLWRPNCGYLQGLLFYVLFPCITVVLAVALAYALSGSRFRYRRMLLVALGVLLAVLGPVYDLGFHPQFYSYNHVFGGVLGPIYDEELAVRSGLFAHRGLTVLWALLFFYIGRRLRGVPDQLPRIAAVMLLIGLSYLFAARLGFNTPEWYIQEVLEGQHRTEHFALYFDPADLSGEEVRRLGEVAEYRYAWLADRLDMGPDRVRSQNRAPDRVTLYLYPDPETKAQLTGARYTSVAPVWLANAQIHMLRSDFELSFGHELVHVFSRSFGLPLLRASAAVGLVEGLAVALQPPDGRPTPDEQVLAVALREAFPGEQPTLAPQLARRISPLGFWTGRGAVSYATMGSFVGFLIDRYGPDRFKEVYAAGRFEQVYGKPVLELAREWEASLWALPSVAAASEVYATRRFARPSLFEQRCPHYVPRHVRAYRRGLEALAQGDMTAAETSLEQSLQYRPGFTPALVQRQNIALTRGQLQQVVASLDTVAAERREAGLERLLGDAHGLLEVPEAARRHYRAALEELPLFAHDSRARISLRMALADRPAVLSLLVQETAPARRAEALEALAGGPAVNLQLALLLMEAGWYEPALQLWRTTGPLPAVAGLPHGQDLVRRQRFVWHAAAAYRAGALQEAGEQAQAAARAFDAVGDRNAAQQLRDEARRMAWLIAHAETPAHPFR